MTTAVFKGGKHNHEHFQFEDKPDQILVQTKTRGGPYGRGPRTSIYQDTGQHDSGCRVYSYVRSTRTILDGFVETR